jgi:hypothetical protein
MILESKAWHLHFDLIEPPTPHSALAEYIERARLRAASFR